MKSILLCILVSALLSGQSAQSPKSHKIALVKNAYSGAREGAELSPGPDALERGGLQETLAKLNCIVAPSRNARLTPAQDREYSLEIGFVPGEPVVLPEML
jgi:hypothetical protein